VAALGVLVSACGGSKYTYVANKNEKTYFRVPSGWHQVDEIGIDQMLSGVQPDSAKFQLWKSMTWSVAYDAATEPSGSHMTSIMASDSPILYVSIRHVLPSEQDQVSYDALRDSLFAVSAPRRQALEDQAKAAGQQLPEFELLKDDLIGPKDGVHGVRSIFNVDVGEGVLNTFDQTALASADSSTIYLLLIRCTARCYRERVAEINDIATSFTVRSKV
jgi:hypothetical protein